MTAICKEALIKAVDALRVGPTSNPDEPSGFRMWTRTEPAARWAKYDLGACALGWNAALDAVTAGLSVVSDRDEP